MTHVEYTVVRNNRMDGMKPDMMTGDLGRWKGCLLEGVVSRWQSGTRARNIRWTPGDAISNCF